MTTHRILGIAGSLRRRSYNKAILRSAAELTPNNAKIEIHDLADIPLFNHDIERELGFPPPVEELRIALHQSDGLLIATPEYNWSIPGVLKNTIDWLSRGPDSPLDRKPTAIVGGGGRLGTAYAQSHLRQVLMHNDVRVVNRPVVLVDRVSEHFDDDMALINDRFRDQIHRLLQALVVEIEDD